MRLARGAVAVLVLLLAVAVVGGVIALVQRNRAEDERALAFARQLAAESTAQRSTDPELALLLGTEAVRTRAIPETETALRAALAGNHLRAVVPAGERRLNSVEFSPDGKTVLTAGNDGRARLFDVSSRALTETFRAGPPGVTHAAFARQGRLVLTTDDRSASKLWNAATGRLVRALPDQADQVTSAAISPDGGLIATAGAKGVHLWTRGGRSRGVIGSPRDPIDSVAFSPDGRLLASGDWLGVVRVRRLARGTTGPKMGAGPGAIESVSFDPSGHYVLAASEDGVVRVWDVASGSPDGALLAIAEQSGDARVQRISDGRVVEVLRGQGRGIRLISFSPDGSSLLALGFDGVIRLWDRDRGKVVLSFGNRQLHFTDAVFSPDGNTIAAISGARISIIELESGATVRTAPLSSHRLRSVDYSSDGRVIVVADEDGKATALDAESLRPVSEFVVTGESLTAAAFGANAAFVALSGDGGLSVYRCDLCASASRLLAIAQAGASRGLSPTERRRYLHESN